MAFFSGWSASAGKALLLFGLRHLDILDKDPKNFVDVKVGKETTLEVRDVGLSVKKLVSLLHIKLPPEIGLSKATASLLRVTFVLNFRSPRFIVEVDGIQIHARLLEDAPSANPRETSEASRSRPRSPPRRRVSSPPPPADFAGDTSDDEDEYTPTVDDIAQSFIREEPAEAEEIKKAILAQAETLQDSVSSSDDTDDESVAGLGAPLGLNTFFRNLLNTALDRLEIVASHIDIQVEDQSSPEPSSASSDSEAPYVSLNFHVDRITIDSITSEAPQFNVAATSVAQGSDVSIGQRRMRLENIYARMISDADNFATASRLSRASSPADTRSDIVQSRGAQSESSTTDDSVHSRHITSAVERLGSPQASQGSVSSLHEQMDRLDVHPTGPSQPLSSSVLTTDEDRFADAASDDGSLDRSMSAESIAQSQESLPPQPLSASSILYDDEGLLEYALQNEMFDSRINAAGRGHDSMTLNSGMYSSQQLEQSQFQQESPTLASPSRHVLRDPPRSSDDDEGLSLSRPSEPLISATDNLDAARHHALEEANGPMHDSPPPPSDDGNEDLAASKVFTHEEAESMYMSAVSAVPSHSSYRPAVPGAWDSGSSSSQDTGSDTSAPVPDDMVAGSILGPVAETDDGCETPRPGSPQSVLSRSSVKKAAPASDHDMGSLDSEPKLSKLFLTIDTITALFPLGLTETPDNNSNVEQTMDHPELSFSDPNLGEDSIFQEMPGSFSNYAHSTSRRKGSVNIAEPKRPSSKHSHVEQSPFQAKKEASATVSIEVGSVVAHIDLSLGRIMFQMIDRTLKALSTMDGASKDSATSEAVSIPPTPNSPQPSISISMKRFGVAWLEQLMTESVVGASPPRSTLDASPRDAILRINLAMVQLASQTIAEEMRTRLQIGKFDLSSVDQNMLSFESPRPRSRRSVGTSDPLKNDIEIDYQESKDRRITVVTRPVKISLDIQSLDDALGSFGGFSGILELGNSISSANTAHSPAISVAPVRARGVHFGDTLPPVAPPEPSKMPKIHVQFGEVAFVLKGKSCALQLQTTSVRVAVRESNVRLKIAEIQLSGPYVDGSSIGPPLLIDVKGTTINFLFTPEEVDLTKLISMITPSKDPYENDEDILIDTLLRQRRKGSVLRAEVTSVDVRISDLEQVKTFEALGAELAKLSKVTKYLPDDDRPGILTLATAQQVEVSLTVNENLGDLSLSLQNASLAHVGVPSLLAVELGKTTLRRGEELLLHEVATLRPQDQLPMVMVRIVGDEMEPVIKAKLFNVCVEYHVSTVMAALGLSDDGTADDIALGLAASVATITGTSSPKSLSRQSSQSSSSSVHSSKPLHVDLLLRSCGLGLNPRKIPAKALFIMSDAHFSGKTSKKDTFAMAVELRKASLHAIDDIGRIGQQEVPSSLAGLSSLAQRQLRELQEYGYVSLSSISAAEVQINVLGDGKEQAMSVEFKNELFVLESCADSTQTLIAILNGLQPPTPPSTAEKYRTVVPYEQMMESLHVDELMHEEITAEENFMDNADLVSDEVPTNLDFVGSFYGQELPTEEDLGDSMLGEDDLGALASPPAVKQRGGQPLLESFQEQYEVGEEEGFDFSEDHFRESDSHQEGKARKWDSDKGQYHLTNEFKTTHAPLKVRVRNVNIVWNLYDGYDWPRTRGVITQAVEDVEARAEERRQRGRDEEEDLDFVEEDFLFNSVWIGVPIKDEKGTLARQINREIDDLASETGSYATSTATRSTGATIRPGSATKTRRRKLKLERSKNKKIAIQLSDVAADVIVFPADTGQTQNSVNVRVQEFEIFDHVPSSTWSKFVTSQIEPTRREMDRPMIDLELLTVKPVTDLVASELVIQVTVQPLRLHVDQDALDFITRFFEFKDDSIPDDDTSSSEQPFIQRLEVMAVKLKLDYKPKRVDYGGLRSGHTTEFMNFVVLEDCPILLRHAIVYGIPSFDRLHKTLNDVWMPDVKRNQLPQVLTGLAAVRPVVNVASGMRDIVVVPLREYRKDGRIARSLGKGLFAFAKNTTSEAARLGAKVAIGTQNILEGAETFLNPQSASPRSSSALQEWDDLDAGGDHDDEPRAVSNYANQPLGIKDGLRSASRRFQEDFRRAQDAIFAIPSEAMEVGSGMGMARAIARHGPTIMIRPGIGVAKAVSHTLHGVGNALDKDSKRKIDNKYKAHLR